MRVLEQPDGSLVLTHDSTLWTKVLMAGAALLLATAAYDWLVGSRGNERLIGLLASAGICIVVGLVQLERASFRIDPGRKAIDWDRRWGFRRRTGSTPFVEVRGVVVEVPIGDTGVPNRRITLHLTDGTVLPITVGYQPDSDGEIARTAERIRRALGQPSDLPPADAARLMVERGQIVDAIKVLRTGEALSLTDAKRRVDEMQASMKRSEPVA